MPRQIPFGPQDRDLHSTARLTLATVRERASAEISNIDERRQAIQAASAQAYARALETLGQPPQADYSSPETAVDIIVYLARADYLSGRHGGRGVAKIPLETAGESWTRRGKRQQLRDLLIESIRRVEVTVEIGVSGETDAGEAFGNVPLTDEIHVTIIPRP